MACSGTFCDRVVVSTEPPYPASSITIRVCNCLKQATCLSLDLSTTHNPKEAPITMPLSLSPATENDLPGICEVHYHAFTDPFSLTLHPRTSYASHVEAYSNHLRRSMQNPSQYILKVVDDLSGRIVSFAKWSVACLKEELQKEEAEKREKEEQANNGNEEPSKPPQVLAEEGHGADGVAAPHRNKVVNMEFGNAFKKKITDIQMRHVGDRRTLCASTTPMVVDLQGR